MATVSLDPYIFFRGNCREAMEFYQDLFGGTLEIQTYADAKMGDESQKDWIMHAMLSGGHVKLMASDTPQASPKAAKVTLSLSDADDKILAPIFDKLAVNGEVISGLKKEFWGDIFGNLVDKYGIEWMVNIPDSKS